MKIYNKFFYDYINLDPEMGSYIGERKYDKYYTISISQEYRDNYSNLCKEYLYELSKQKYQTTDDIYIKVFKYFLELEQQGSEYEDYLIPLEPSDNKILNFIELSLGESYLPLKTLKNYKNMIIQYQGFEKWINVALQNMRIGIKKKYILSKLQCKIVIKQINNVLTNKRYMPNISNIPISIKNEYLQAIDKYFVNNIKLIQTFIKNEYLPHCLDEGGLSFLPNGKKEYQYLINYYTTLNNFTPEKIHKLGLDEVKRITEELNNVKNKFNYEGNLKQFNDYMVNNPNNYYKTSTEIINAFEKIQTVINKTIMPKYFNLKINYEYDIKSIPSYLSHYSTTAYYMMAPHDNSRKGTLYLDSNNIKSFPIYEIKTLSLHEGNPGHHFQLTYSIDKKIPKLFLYIMDSTAYVEGWGLYCESFINKDDYFNEYGRLNYEMIRAVRLVIDTGIHYYGWSYQKAYDYYEKHCISYKKETHNEILRYIQSPGQAISYKIGEIFIKNLRDEYLKKNNDIKAFHKDFLKDGALPLCFM